MGTKRHKLLGRAAAAAALFSLAQGCALFPLSNPILPQARLLITPSPNMITVAYTYSQQQQTLTWKPDGATKIHIQSYPNDATPGVYINSYSAEYFDMAGKPIPSVLLSKANFGISAYVPPSSQNAQKSIDIEMPIYNQQVALYGTSEAYSFGGTVSLNPNFSHTITARVTLYGEDDNYNQVQYQMDMPIRFTAEITQ